VPSAAPGKNFYQMLSLGLLALLLMSVVARLRRR